MVIFMAIFPNRKKRKKDTFEKFFLIDTLLYKGIHSMDQGSIFIKLNVYILYW